jgi:hypothetical protein
MDARGSRGATLSSDVFSLWDLDWDAGKLRIVLQTGEQVVEDMGAAMSRPSREIARSVFDWDKWWLTTFTTRGHLVISEVWSPVGDPVKSRPAVYLDQNHWSTVAKSLVRPQALSPPDLAAAQRVVALVMDGGIRLPISSATLQETAALFGERRYEVGVTIASLSGGWQLRDPIEVRKQEFAAWFGERLDCERRSPLADVVTLEPRSVFGDRVGPAIERQGDGSSAELFLDALTWPSVLVSLLIHPEPTPSSPPEQWAQANAQFAERIRTMTREQRTSATTLAAIADNQRIIVEALARLDDPAALLERASAEDLAGAVTEPSFGGLFTRIMAARLMARTGDGAPTTSTM